MNKSELVNLIILLIVTLVFYVYFKVNKRRTIKKTVGLVLIICSLIFIFNISGVFNQNIDEDMYFNMPDEVFYYFHPNGEIFNEYTDNENNIVTYAYIDSESQASTFFPVRKENNQWRAETKTTEKKKTIHFEDANIFVTITFLQFSEAKRILVNFSILVDQNILPLEFSDNQESVFITDEEYMDDGSGKFLIHNYAYVDMCDQYIIYLEDEFKEVKLSNP